MAYGWRGGTLNKRLDKSKQIIFYGVGWRGGTLKKYPRQVEAKDGMDPPYYC